MLHPRRAARLVGPILAVALTASCTIPSPRPRIEPSQTDPSEQDAGVAEADPAPEELEEPEEVPLPTLEYTDSDGYSFRIELTDADITLRPDIDHSKPGEAMIVYELDVKGRVENLTPDRTANVGGLNPPTHHEGR